MNDTRLIERWLPIAELSEECIRERRSMTALPPIYYLHVWWARRPLVASRAAILASLLPADADRDRFLHVLGIHGDPVTAREAIDRARRTGVRVEDPYGYERAFKHSPNDDDRQWFTDICGQRLQGITVLDPTAGGGSIPFEAARLGFAPLANDLNPVAALIMKATVEWPLTSDDTLEEEFTDLAHRWREQLEERLSDVFPQHRLPDRVDATYLWARTITCPYCDGRVPLSPNWRLAPNGTGVRLKPNTAEGPGSPGRVCEFEVVQIPSEQSLGTQAKGDGICPFSDCGRVIDGDEIKRQALADAMGEQLYAVVFKKRVPRTLKSGKRGKDKWVRGYRAPRPEDDNSAEIRARLEDKLPEWEAFDIVPNEPIPDGNKTGEPLRYGMSAWLDLFSPRQLLCHGTSAEVFREMLDADEAAGELNETQKAAYGYLALSLDKLLNYNSRMSIWMPTREVVANTFNRHDFAFCWSHGEMAPLIEDLGYDWAIAQTGKCIGELVSLVHPESQDSQPGLLNRSNAPTDPPPPVAISCKSGDNLDHVEDGSIDVVVIDPPYYDNVMYAELSDFFYVWLKRTAGRVFPELFRRRLTDKDSEAVANPTRFKGEKGARALAGRDYRQRMAAIFAECRRVLKPNGIMTLMFTHKATGAWDALTTGLMEAGFAVTASWPVNTEAESSLHIKDKAAANSTVFLACRPRAEQNSDSEAVYWEDVEPRVARAVRERIEAFSAAGIRGVDLYLAAFGPALEEFSRHWPLKRGRPREVPEQQRRRRQQVLFEEEWDPYAATPEDALEAARREVKRWRLEQLTHLKAGADLDPVTAFFVLAWDAFEAPVFPYDEALRLARAVGVDLDGEIVGRLAEKKASNLQLWDSARRAAKGAFGPVDGSRGMIDAIHRAAHTGRQRSLQAAREMLENAGTDHEPRFFAALEAVLEVLPVSSTFSGIELKGDTAAASDDFEALYNLTRLAYREEIDEPEQLSFWRTDEE